VLLIPVAAWFAAIIAGRKTAWLVAALVALSAPLIDYSQEARTYSLLALLVMMAATGLVLVLRRVAIGQIPTLGSQAIFGLGAVASFYAHFCSIFWIGPACLLLAVAGWRQPSARARRSVVLLAFVIEMLAMPGIVRLVRSIGGEVSFTWLPHATPAQFLATIGEQLLPTGRWTPNYLQQAHVTGVLAGTLLLQIVVMALWSRTKRGARDYDTAVLAIFAFAPLAMWLSGYLITATFMPRTMLWTVPGQLTIIAATLIDFGGAAAALCAVTAYAIALAFSGTMRTDRQDPRPIIAMVRAAARPGDVLLACQAWRATELRAVADRPLPMPLIARVDRKTMLLEPIFGSDRKWTSHFGYIVGRPITLIETRSLPTSGRAWLVDSICIDRNWVRFNQWLGRGRWTRIREDAPDALLPNVLWRFDPAEAPRARTVEYRASD
jgi:hypothetical protein